MSCDSHNPHANNGNYKRQYDIQVTCEACHKPFTASRSDAKFCSPVCRKAQARQLAEIERMGAQVLALLLNLERFNKDKNSRLSWAAGKQIGRIKTLNVLSIDGTSKNGRF